MRRRLLLLVDALLIIAIGVLGVRLYGTWHAQPSAVPVQAPAPAVAEPTPLATPTPPPTPLPLSAFAVVAEHNLFSPTRTETMPDPPKPQALVTPASKPLLYGLVLDGDGEARAWLEDPKTRKVFRYAIGDTVADSRVEEIRADRVVLRRGGEVFEVLLRDPAKPKPKPAPAVPTAAMPAVRQAPGAALEGQVPPAGPGGAPESETPPQIVTPAPAPGGFGPPAARQGVPRIPGLRRFSPGAAPAPPPASVGSEGGGSSEVRQPLNRGKSDEGDEPRGQRRQRRPQSQ